MPGNSSSSEDIDDSDSSPPLSDSAVGGGRKEMEGRLKGGAGKGEREREGGVRRKTRREGGREGGVRRKREMRGWRVEQSSEREAEVMEMVSTPFSTAREEKEVRTSHISVELPSHISVELPSLCSHLHVLPYCWKLSWIWIFMNTLHES